MIASGQAAGGFTGFTYTEDTDDYEKDYLKEMPVTVVGDLEQYQLPRSERVHCLKAPDNSDARHLDPGGTYGKRHSSHQGAEEAPPERLDAKVIAHFLGTFCDNPRGLQKKTLTSIENKTPPIGDPNATATPAALAAVTISRIFPAKANKQCVTHK